MNILAQKKMGFWQTAMGSWRRFRRSRIARRVMILAGGTLFAQVLSITLAPILTRLYTPDQFGHLAVFSALFTFLTTFIALKYEHAIPIADDKVSGINLLVLSLLISLIQALVLGALIGAFAAEIPRQWLPGELRPYLWLLPLGLFINSVYSGVTHWLIREKDFTPIAKTKIWQSISKSFLEVGLGVLSFKSLGLLLGFISGQFGGTLQLIRRIWSEERTFLKEISFKRMMNCARRYKNYPVFVVPCTILNSLSTVLPYLVLPMMFGAAKAGLFLISQRLTTLPIRLVGHSIAQVFYAEIASQPIDQKRNRQLFIKISKRLGLIGLLGGIFMLSAPVWTGLLLGRKWAESGWVIAALAPVLVARLGSAPLSHAYHIRDRQSLWLGVEVVGILLASLGLAICHYHEIPFLATVLVYSGARTLSYLCHWIAIYWLLCQPSSMTEETQCMNSVI